MPIRGLSIIRALVAGVITIALASLVADAQSPAFSFQQLAAFDDPAPGGGTLAEYFELGGLNNARSLALAAGVLNDVTGEFGEAVMVLRDGGLSLIARSGEVAPGGNVFGGGSLFPLSLNDRGDVIVSFSLEPFQLPVEASAGLFLYERNREQLTALVLPTVPSPFGTFRGVGLGPTIANNRRIGFGGLIPSSIGPGAGFGVGSGVFVLDRVHGSTPIARPGDPSPGGSTFDWAAYPSMNSAGDLVFAGHRSNQPACPEPAPDLFCIDSGIYFADGATGALRAVAVPGDPAPGGGVFTIAAFGRVNISRTIAFLGRTSVQSTQFSVFMQNSAGIQSIAMVGDAAPGGGHFTRLGPASSGTNPLQIDSSGRISFLARLDTDVDNDGNADTGAFQWVDGVLTTIARTGTVAGDLGVVRAVRRNDIATNDRGDAAFWARLTDGREVILLATPQP